MAFLLEPPPFAWLMMPTLNPGSGGVAIVHPCPVNLKGQGMLKSILAICIGASLGALLRWWLGTELNSHFPTIPPGTLAANLIGAYIIGLGIALFASFPALAPEWRLFVITGFCGGLTTFSTFSAEIVASLQEGQPLWMCGAVLAHLAGSILMTFAGMGTVSWLRS